ncbi:hypothetical protein JD844_002676 [Phrynosoma platyrhinos]|uniref:ITPR-interacting domain-containing protein n=1 Tax=Phrynosoma platyrhinos TaxID=52577 RepID=A0ABQ7TCD9_PHRPL|nr:hypothetical protein JD844_002676 [Phrynosoma platyrhinos]
MEVLDHVTSAFSSLLNDVSALQQKSEGRNREKTAVDSVKEKPVFTQTKRRRIGQLLRKASRQTSMQGSQAYRSVGPCKAKEDCCPAADVDSTVLVSLKEELFPSEEMEEAMTVIHLPQARVSKTWALPHLPIKQPHFPSCSEMALKDRPRKEPNLLSRALKMNLPGEILLKALQNAEM